MSDPPKRQPKKRATAKKAARKRAPRKPGRPTLKTPAIEQRIVDELAAGTPLTIICEPADMPAWRTVYDWMDRDTEFSAAIARAREVGFDRLAFETIAIADSSERDTITLEKAGVEIEIPDKEWILRSKLRVETRLKLLSKWDPKRYGDKVSTEISGPGGGPIKQSMEITPEIEERIRAAAQAAQDVKPPHSFRGETMED